MSWLSWLGEKQISTMRGWAVHWVLPCQNWRKWVDVAKKSFPFTAYLFGHTSLLIALVLLAQVQAALVKQTSHFLFSVCSASKICTKYRKLEKTMWISTGWAYWAVFGSIFSKVSYFRRWVFFHVFMSKKGQNWIFYTL